VATESYSSGYATFPTDPRRVRWQKMLIQLRTKGGTSAEDPKPTDSLRQIQVKVLNCLKHIYGI
jgi:hypothetical protein